MRDRLTDLDYILATDASVRQSPITNRSYSSYAGALVNLKERAKATYSGNLDGYSSIAYCETYAIYAGLQILVKALDGREAHVLVISDNKMAVSAFTCYIPYIWRTDGEVWKKADGRPVKNQGIFKRVKKLLEDNRNLRAKFAHINSHQEIATQWPRMERHMAKWGVFNSKQSVKFIMRLNAEADQLAARVSSSSRKAEEAGNRSIRLGGSSMTM